MGLVPPWDSYSQSRDSHGTRTPTPGTPIATPRRDSHSYSHCHATPGSRHHALSSLRKNSSWESQVLWDSPRHGTVPGLHGSRHAALPGRVPLVLPGLGLPVIISRTPLTAVMRSYQGYYTRSHQNSEVKRLWAGIVLGWVTSREVPVLHPFLPHIHSSTLLDCPI
jgi:hypothetical protein